MAGAAAAVDLHHEVGGRKPEAHVEVFLDGLDGVHGRGVQVVARIGLERAVVAQEAKRPDAPPGDEVSRVGKRVGDPAEQESCLIGWRFMGESPVPPRTPPY